MPLSPTQNENAWAEIARRAREATGPDRELDCAVHVARQDGGTGRYENLAAWTKAAIAENWNVPRISASVDATLALIAEKLPGWRFSLDTWEDGHLFAVVWPPDWTDPYSQRATNAIAATPALALLAAFALAMEPSHVAR